MNLAIELEQETDGRWIAEIDALNGVLVYVFLEKLGAGEILETSDDYISILTY